MNDIKWIVAVFCFFGVWIEVALNGGFLGLLLGWFPAVTVAYVWLNLTGAMKFNERPKQCPHL